jgi:hypothetical protein
MITYDSHFNWNEWFVLGMCVVSYFLVISVPHRFPRKESLVYLLYGIYIGHLFDHTISIPPFDFYDVNDTSAYEIMDFMSYTMYGPFSYFFLYIYDRGMIARKFVPLYIVAWTTLAVSIEAIGRYVVGLYHYKEGYNLYISFPIYLFVQSVLLCLHHYLQWQRKST